MAPEVAEAILSTPTTKTIESVHPSRTGLAVLGVQDRPAPAFDSAATETDLLYLISQELLSPSEDLSSVLTAVLGHLCAHMGAERAMITVLDRLTGEIREECSHGLSDEERRRGRYKIGEGIIGRVIDRCEPALIPSIAGEPQFLDRTCSRIHIDTSKVAFLCVPLATRRDVLGTLSVDRPTQLERRLDEDLRFLTVVAALIGEAVRGRRDHQEELEQLRRENRRLEELAHCYLPDSIIGTSREMRHLYDLVSHVATSNTSVLIRGESGTGKELVAREIHARSERAKKPWVAVNCATLPEQLVESELFGHVRGAFTGAHGQRKGCFEMADGGTIFLDEVGEIPPHIQAKLLRVLQEGEIHRLGDDRTKKVDVRVIAATNVDLERAIENGRFREDLYYRLNVFPVHVPPLRERVTDITLLADHFVDKYAKIHNRSVVRISTPAIELMTSYHWPGNVRELENCVSRAVLLTKDGVIRQHQLPPTLQTGRSSGTAQKGSFDEMMMAFEREIILEAMKDASGNQAKAARALKTTPRILGYALRRHGLLDRFNR
jgi:Nif-specific regulatory protein